MTPHDRLLLWDTEISAELTAAREALTDARKDHAAAVEAAAAAERLYRDLQALVATMTNPPPGQASEQPATPLALRLRAEKAAVEATHSTRIRAHNAVQQQQRRIDELENAQRQIAALMAPREEAAA